jgi:hypothetical protein
LNLRSPGLEPTHGSRENQSKALNRRRIDEQLSPLIGLHIGLQIAGLACAEKNKPGQITKLFKKKRWVGTGRRDRTRTPFEFAVITAASAASNQRTAGDAASVDVAKVESLLRAAAAWEKRDSSLRSE